MRPPRGAGRKTRTEGDPLAVSVLTTSRTQASPAPADAYTARGWSVHRPALDVEVADTVGAGDSFTAGLIGSLLRRGQYAPADLARCPADELSGALDDAILVASVNCERRGNDPPTAADVAAARLRLKPT